MSVRYDLVPSVPAVAPGTAPADLRSVVLPRAVKIRAIFEELELKSHYELPWDDDEYWSIQEPIRFHSSPKTPPGLQACRESRACLGKSGGSGYTHVFTGALILSIRGLTSPSTPFALPLGGL